MDAQLPVRTEQGKLALVAFGANKSSEGKSLQSTVESAVQAISRPDLALRDVSALYATPSFPPGSGPDFINGCASFETRLDALAILAHLHDVEAAFGRTRERRWGARTLDLDLLALDDVVRPDAATLRHWIGLPPDRQRVEAPDRLILPHPRLQDRAFVLVPLADIAPGWRHPLLGRLVSEMLADLPDSDRAAIRKL